MIVALNPQFTIRNEEKCSYIIKKIWNIDPIIGENTDSVTLIPPVMGYILSTIGQTEYEASLKSLSNTLGVSKDSIRHFTSSLIENEEQKELKIGSDTIRFPQRLLIKSDYPIKTDTLIPNTSFQLLHLRPQIPININFMVTTKCTTNCSYCYAKRNLKTELKTEEIVHFIEECKKLGIVNLSLTGGDIFAHTDWKTIIATVTKNEYKPFLSTKTPLNEEDIKFLHDTGIQELQFSLDSIEPKILSQLIQVNDNYLSKVYNTFKYCEKYGIKLCVRSVLCAINSQVNQIENLLSFLKGFTNIKDWVMTPAFFSEFKQEEYHKNEVSNENLIKIKNFIKETTKTFPIYLSKISKCGYKLKKNSTVYDYVKKNQICQANSYTMSVLASGECTICEMLYENEEYSLGNIKELSLNEIWNSPKALSLFSPEQNETSTSSPCHTCEVFDECKKKLDKRICYVDIAKTNEGITKDLPDPRCPLSKPINVIL